MVHTPTMTSDLSTSIDIDASPPAVWAVLTDTAAYPEWNPFVRELGGELVEGGRLRVRIGPPGRRPVTLRPQVVHLEPERRLVWLGRFLIPRLFDGQHSFVLEPRPGGGTRFTQSEHFRGILVPFMGRLLASTATGFDAMNEALRARCEGVPRPSSPSSAGSASAAV